MAISPIEATDSRDSYQISAGTDSVSRVTTEDSCIAFPAEQDIKVDLGEFFT